MNFASRTNAINVINQHFLSRILQHCGIIPNNCFDSFYDIWKDIVTHIDGKILSLFCSSSNRTVNLLELNKTKLMKDKRIMWHITLNIETLKPDLAWYRWYLLIITLQCFHTFICHYTVFLWD